jgi:hypothetical protein
VGQELRRRKREEQASTTVGVSGQFERVGQSGRSLAIPVGQCICARPFGNGASAVDDFAGIARVQQAAPHRSGAAVIGCGGRRGCSSTA